MKVVRPCLVLMASLLAVCCVVYPALVTLVGGALFPHEARGSPVSVDGVVRGSSLIGQTLREPAAHPEYFWGRPSAASADPVTGVLVSGGTNYGPLHPGLAADVEKRVAALRATGVAGPIPVDLVTASGSGLDPHVSPAAAEVQVPRVARARGLDEGTVRELVAAHTEQPMLGLVGEARVNVLALNLALDGRAAGAGR
jgi:K+-transporting ATPase ATPase C chain